MIRRFIAACSATLLLILCLAAATQVDWKTQVKNMPPGFASLSTASPSNGQVLGFNGTSWVASTSSAAFTLNTNTYNFTPISPGVSLTGGVQATLTITCPLGVYGADTVANGKPHLLYISGGTGTAEPVLIQGGTCNGNNQSGTLIFTPINSHTGAYTIQSDSSGIQECIMVAGNTGACQMPAQSLDLWGNCPAGGTCNGNPATGVGAVNIPDGWGPSLRGTRSSQGEGLTFISTHGTTGDWIVGYYSAIAGAPIDLGDFVISDSAATYHTSGAMVKVRYRSGGLVSNIRALYCYDCIYSEGNYGIITFDNVGGQFTNRGVYIGCNSVIRPTCQSMGTYRDIQVTNEAVGGSTGIDIEAPTVGIYIINPIIQDASTGANAILLDALTVGQALNEINILGGVLDGYSNGYSVTGTSCHTDSIQLIGQRIAPLSYGVITNTAAACNIQVADAEIVTEGGNANDVAVKLLGGTSTVSVKNSFLSSDGQYTVTLTGTVTGANFTGNVFGAVATIGCINFVSGTIAGPTVFQGNDLSGCSGVVTDSATHTGVSMFKGNAGVDTTMPAVATAATFPFPVNPSFSTTGTTGITAVTVPLGFSAGFTWNFVAAGTTSTTAGASIGNSCTVTATKAYTATWDGTKMWFNGPGC